MATSNPYANDDPVKAEVWELGYVAGFQDPDATDTFQPLAPELLDIYNQGTGEGRTDRMEPPAGDPQATWVSRSELSSEGISELVEHVVIEAIAHIAAELFEAAALGLVGVVLSVLSISDTPLQPLDESFNQPYTGPETDMNVSFIALCPRTDHVMAATGTTQEGYWAGTPQNDFGAALKDALDHGHSEAIVARCSLTDNTCGPVWAAK
jgi:hypothetical protein